MLLWVFLATVSAREVVTQKTARPAAAWFVMNHASTGSCAIQVVVAADGKPVHATPSTCTALYDRELRKAAMGWRWERHGETTVEVIELSIRRPEFAPRSPAGKCVAGMVIQGQNASLLAPLPSRCTFRVGPVEPAPHASPPKRSWCEVTVTVENAEQQVHVGGCSEGFQRRAAAAVRSWELPSKDQQWTFWLGYESS
jgi:hypothetical protein